MKNIILTDAPFKLREARKVKNVPYELHDFCDFLAEVVDNQVMSMDLAMLVAKVLESLLTDGQKYGGKEFPNKLESEKYQITIYMNYFPLIVDEIASKEFAENFRLEFDCIFGESQPPIDEMGENYGVRVIGKGVVDISSKDKGEVLAALYNYSHPHGLGFLEYDPSPMSIEEARKLLKENSYFDYINGRVMKISLIGNLITTHGYNCENGDGVAERIISHCHNIK